MKQVTRVGPLEITVQPLFQLCFLLPGSLWSESALPHAPTTEVSHPALTFFFFCHISPFSLTTKPVFLPISSCFCQVFWSPWCKSGHCAHPPIMWWTKLRLWLWPLESSMCMWESSGKSTTVCAKHTLFAIPSLAVDYIVKWSPVSGKARPSIQLAAFEACVLDAVILNSFTLQVRGLTSTWSLHLESGACWNEV